jgi:hypothetical protein
LNNFKGLPHNPAIDFKRVITEDTIMSVTSQTFGLSMNRAHAQRGASFTAIGARLWMSLVAKIKARRAAASDARAEQEMLALAAWYEKSFPSFAAELRAASGRRE